MRSMWIDYIFSSRTLQLAETPSVTRCPDRPIPDDVYGSDHVPVKVKLRFLQGATQLEPRLCSEHCEETRPVGKGILDSEGLSFLEAPQGSMAPPLGGYACQECGLGVHVTD